MTKGDFLWLAFFAFLYKFADKSGRFWLSFMIVYGGAQAIFALHLNIIWMIICLLGWRLIWDVATMGR